MKTMIRMGIVVLASLVLGAGSVVLSAQQGLAPERGEAQQILKSAGIQGGLIVHLGCRGGKLTAALRLNQSYLVHGLDADEQNIERARKHLQSLGLCGAVSVERWTGVRLPYADNMVNLVVAEDLGATGMDEVMRVLCPGGVAWLKEDGQGTKTVKPRPSEIDEWTHFLHGPDNNAVANDSVVDQPAHLQWVADPAWARSHDHLSSTSAVVSAGGRIFSIVDEGSIALAALAPRWSLVARDAFNGVLLWKRAIDSWEGHLRGFRAGPTELARRLVAVGDRVYVTLGYGKPVTALDAATGQTVMTYAQTDNALEILCCEGMLLVVVGDRAPDNTAGAGTPASPENYWQWWPIYQEKPPRKAIVALEAGSGSVLWRKSDGDTVDLMPTTLAAAQGRVFFQSARDLVALDAKSGQVFWRTPRPTAFERPTWSAPTLVVYGDVVLLADRTAANPRREAPEAGGESAWIVDSNGGQSPPAELAAYRASTGEKLWSCPCRESYNSPADVLVAGGLVWTGDLVRAADPGITAGRDVLTGQIGRERPLDRSQFTLGMGHHRCYRNKATERYLLLGRDGIEFIELASGKGVTNPWTRGACQYGIMPCNGLVYSPPHSCACHIEIKLNGFLAFAPQRAASAPSVAEEDRLEQGPAYRAIGDQSPAVHAGDWPTYRHDARRSGHAGCEVPARLDRRWSARLEAGRLSSPVVADGKVFVAGIDAHTVYALDAEQGQVAWTYTASGRVDSPPTFHQGLVLFGCADGRVYCLRASDGQLVWRFLVAPEDRRVVCYGQLESAWPIHGSVLIEDDVACVAAGRSTYLDGGIYLCRLDPRTGRKLSQSRVEAGALPDVLSSDGSSIYMRHLRFDKQGAALEPNVPHLFSPAGFLDDSWWHRTYWLVGTQMRSAWGGWPIMGNQVPAGRLLAVGDDSVYGFGCINQYHRNGTHVGLGAVRYRLYACPAGSKGAEEAHGQRAGRVGGVGGKQGRRPSVGVPAGSETRAEREARAERGGGEKSSASGRAKRRGDAAPAVTQVACRWSQQIPLQARAMVLSGKTLFVAGPPDVLGDGSGAPPENPYYIGSPRALVEQDAALAGQRGGLLWAVSTADGQSLSQQRLPSPPVFDGMVAARERLYVCTMDGQVLCLGDSR